MGWTSQHRAAGISDRDFFARDLGKDYRFIETASVNRATFYAAVEQISTGQVSALVILMRWSRTDYYNFSHKWMGEEVGPCETGAPARVLDALTDTDSEWANEWRAACRARLARREQARSVKAGVSIRLATPLRFSDNVERDTFTLISGSRFRAADGVVVRLTNWRDRAFTLV